MKNNSYNNTVDSDWSKSIINITGDPLARQSVPSQQPTGAIMKLENIKVAARLRESPSALFKVNKLTLSEDEKSIQISSLNGKKRIVLLYSVIIVNLYYVDTARNNSKQYIPT